MMPLWTRATPPTMCGMGVADGRGAVGRPARMGDSDRPGERMGGELGGEIVELALGAAALEPAVQDRADAGASHSRDIRAASGPA